MALKGDFLGFYFNGHHSSEFNIVRTSDGSRFNEDLLPSYTNRTVEVPGGDGTYFFGAEFKLRPFQISFATDCMTESLLASFRLWLGDKKMHTLVLDEWPYKTWLVRIDGTQTFKFICFEDDNIANGPLLNNLYNVGNEYNMHRIYKGEGTLNMIAYYPYASCPNDYKYMDVYKVNSPLWYVIDNKSEWMHGARLLDTQGKYDVYNSLAGGFYIYNAGDIDTDYLLFMPITKVNGTYAIIDLTSTIISSCVISGASAIGNDTHICLNSKTQLLEGYIYNSDTSSYSATGNLYNRYLTAGYLGKIPYCVDGIFLVPALGTETNVKLLYNYLYY